MRRKILSFITDGTQFLGLKSEPNPEHGPGGWFTVTGSIEGNETEEQAVKREVKEETNLEANGVFSLNFSSVYDWKGELCEESNYLSFVNKGEVKLNEEHSEYAWISLKEFIKRIKWEDDKPVLTKVLEQAIKKRLYFKNKFIKDYRTKSNP